MALISTSSSSSKTVGLAISSLQSRLEELASSADRWLAELGKVFQAGSGGPTASFAAQAEQLRQEVSAGTFSLNLELRSATELRGAYGAYAAGSNGAGQRIFLNSGWAAGASAADVERVLLEELGHAFDQRLNGGVDTAGDEGELFAATVLGTPLDSASLSRIRQENDHGTLVIDGQAVAVEFGAPIYDPANTDTDKDNVNDNLDLDDDNDGILDTVEQQVANSLPVTPKNLNFNYAQNTSGYQSFHSAALVYQTGDKNDPANFFDGNPLTELRVHSDDVYEFGFLNTNGSQRTINAGSQFTLTEAAGTNDAEIIVLASTTSTDTSGNVNNPTGGGQGWKTISAAFNVATVADLKAKYTNNGNQPLVSGDGKLVILYAGLSDSTLTLTTPIPVSFVQMVGVVKHGGWADFSISAEVNLGLDTDSDGIPDSRDLDSDNDGISDLYESVGSKPSALTVAIDANNDGTITAAEVNTYNTANAKAYSLSAQGVWSLVGDPAVANDGNKPIDSDGDGVRDFIDLDSDGDGIPDTIEARPSASFSTNDGNVSNEDTDGDGVIARFDSNDGTTKAFGGSFGTPVNTDSSLGGDGTSSANTGNATKVTLDNSIDSELNALGAPDGKLAKLNSSKDQLVLDLGSIVPSGTTISIVAKKDDGNADNKITISQSTSDGKSLTSSQSFTFTSKGVLETKTFTTTANTQFVSIQFARKKGNLFVDGLTWNYGTSTPGYTPDYLDLNSDNDNSVDSTESGLTRTGVDANNDGIDDGIAASYLDPDGKINNPLGSTTGLKNNDKDASDVDYRSLNTGGVNITNLTVNEGSPYAVFKLDGPTANTTVKLSLINDTDPDTVDAIIGTDLAASPPASGTTPFTELQWLNGSTWTSYVPNTGVTIPANGSLLVRVAIKNDNPAVFEGEEVFRLLATDSGGAQSQGGFGTIIDDGTGDWWKATTNSDTPDASGVTLDNDTPVDINDVTVNEGSPYAVFSLSGVANQAVNLSLATTGTGAGFATSGVDYGTQLQYLNGTTWTNYTAGSSVSLDGTGELLVRVSINNDVPYEGPETYRLQAKIVSNNIFSTGGLGTIIDDGTGDVFLATNKTATPNVSGDTGYPSALDDDRPITVTDVTVNEASPYAIFDIEGNPGQIIKLSLATTGTGTGFATPGADFNGTTLQYLNASNVWTNYTSGSATTLTLPASGELLVRVLINQDTEFENKETYKLNVTNTANNAVSSGIGAIVDDGSGAIYPDNTNGTPDNNATKDDDRPLVVSDIRVNEGSPYAVFTVSGKELQQAKLELNDGSAKKEDGVSPVKTDGTEDYGPQLEYWNGNAWTLYTPGSFITIPGDGDGTPNESAGLLVRTPINPDPVLEGAETFNLKATNTGGTSDEGIGTIDDEGGGVKYPDQQPSNPQSANPTPVTETNDLDDDRSLSVNNIDVNEASPYAVFTITGSGSTPVSLALAASATQAGKTAATLSGGSADIGSQLQYFDGTAWQNYTSGTVNLINGTLLVRVPVINDDPANYEGPEIFDLEVRPQGTGTPVTGTATIWDDGTGNIYPDNKTGNVDPDAVKDDDRLLKINNISVNEGSPYAVFAVTANAGQSFSLSFANGTANPTAGQGDGTPANGSEDYNPTTLQYLDPSDNTWKAYTSAISVAGSGDKTILVRVAINQDNVYEGPEDFKLIATYTSGSAATATGVATILDDGTGNIYPDNKTGNPDPDAPKDDDRPIQVNNIEVNEASPYAVFTVSGSPSQTLTSLSLKLDTDPTTNNATLSGASADIGNKLEYFNGSTWIHYTSGSVNLDASGKLLVRVAVNNDSIYEGPEVFLLEVKTASEQAVGAATIFDDGTGQIYPDNSTGNPDPDAIKDDDRPVKVNDIAVNEASPYGVFTISGTAGQALKLSLQNDNNPTTADATAVSDYTPSLEYFDGTSWQPYTSGNTVNIPAGGKLLVRVPIINDNPPVYEGPETFQLAVAPVGGTAAYGTATILDDGTGNIYPDNPTGNPDPDAIKDDDRPVSVNNIEVNEASPYGVFTVSGTAGQSLKLSLQNDNDPTTADATAVSDYTPSLEYFDGTSWQPYTSGNTVNIPAGGKLLVRIPIVNDNPAVYEGPETFQLAVAPVGGTTAYGTATILDDGTGNIYPNNTSGTPDPNAIKDDDRPVKVNNIEVNEASPYGVFTVSGTAGQALKLSLQNDNDPATADATPGSDFTNSLEYFNGTSWQPYTPGSSVTIPAGGKLLVRVPILNDNPPVYEGPETFQLAVAPVGGTTAYGTATILDDGTGNIYPNNNSGTPDPNAPKDDDRPVKVNDIQVNEASPYGVFTVTGDAGLAVKLALQDDSDPGTTNATPGSDYTNSLEYFNGTSWQPYTLGTSVTIPSGDKLLVRVPILNDNPAVYEGPETFQLAVTKTNGVSTYGTATILDDGTGNIYPDNKTGAPDPNAPKDDDRGVKVNDILVNEGSAWAVFTVNGVGIPSVSLALQNDINPGTVDATLGTDTGTQLQYFNGTYWQNYTGGQVNLVNDKLLVRVAIKNDNIFEGPETFQLAVTPSSGSTVLGTATIFDDGTGNIYPDNPTGNPDPSAPKDDDRGVKVNNILVNEASPYAVFTVTTTGNIPVKLALQNDSDPTTVDATLTGPNADIGSQLQYFDGTTWQNYTPGTSVTPTNNQLLVRVAVNNDNPPVFEGPEIFQLAVTPDSGGSPSYGTATILDDGTGNIYPNNTTGATDPNATKDDDRSLKITNVTVNEKSPYAVFQVTADKGSTLALSLLNDSDINTADALFGTDTQATSTLEVLIGGVWTPYSTSVTIPGPGPGTDTLLVRLGIKDDTTYEGPELFQLKVTNAAAGLTAYGTGTIVDDGTGSLFVPTNTSGTPDAPGTSGGPAQLDDDRPLTVNNILVNEGSPYGIFSVGGASGQLVKLSLTPSSALLASGTPPLTGPNSGTEDFGPGLEYWNGSSWLAYTPNSFIPIPTGTTALLVRTPIVNDDKNEGNETFSLTATNTGDTGATGQATINDQGQGTLFTNGNPPISGGNPVAPVDTVSPKNDDRPTSPSVSIIGSGTVVERALGEFRPVNISINLSSPATQDAVITYRLREAGVGELTGQVGINKPAQPLLNATAPTSSTRDFNGFGNVNSTAAMTGSLTLKAGVTSMLIEIPVLGDGDVENDEAFFVELVSVTGGNNASINNQASKGQIIIIDNDLPARINQDINYSTASNFVDVRGGAGNDTITGSANNDFLYGYEANDIITGNAGADILTGGLGNDVFVYTNINQSSGALSSIDTIRDLVPGTDRIRFDGDAATALTGAGGSGGMPSALFNVSNFSITGTTLAPTLFADAIAQAFADKDPTQAGSQPLQPGEAVIFNVRTVVSPLKTNFTSYMAVNIGNAAYEEGTDFLADISGWSRSGVSTGALSVSNYFNPPAA